MAFSAIPIILVCLCFTLGLTEVLQCSLPDLEFRPDDSNWCNVIGSTVHIQVMATTTTTTTTTTTMMV